MPHPSATYTGRMKALRLVLAFSLPCASLPAAADQAVLQAIQPELAQTAAVKVGIEDPHAVSAGPSVTVSAQATPAPTPGTPPFNVEEHRELDKIQTLNQLDQQRFQRSQRQVDEEKDALVTKNALAAERLKAALAPIEEQTKRLQDENALAEEKRKAQLEALTAERDKLRLENEVAKEKLAAEQVAADKAKLEHDVALQDLDFQSRKVEFESKLTQSRTVALTTDLELRDKKDSWRKQANRDPEYLTEPFKDGVLTVSDRRIALDGVIVAGVADYVTDRIHYFNNKDPNLPIFIIINRCPGGSVMEGYRIVKAIRSSQAPVHVVVKSFAASMAAVIATLAPRSYAYPNAIILHHQLLTVSWGNVTQLKEQLAETEEWYRRLAEPVAKKMGLSVDEFTKQMYKHNSDGDWEEFADRAVELKWIDHVVREIRETGMTKQPDDSVAEHRPALWFGLAEEHDKDGHAHVQLPRLETPDAYWIHNPDNYYR